MPQTISVKHSVCTGCRTCEVVCSLFHSGECNPTKSAIRVIRRENNGLVFSLPLVCQQCPEAPCVAACPTEALFRKSEHDTLQIDREKCSGCGSCMEACPGGAIFLDPQAGVATFCDLCGGEPQCVPLCHSHCLSTGSSGDNGIHQLVEILKAENLWEYLPEKGGRE